MKQKFNKPKNKNNSRSARKRRFNSDTITVSEQVYLNRLKQYKTFMRKFKAIGRKPAKGDLMTSEQVNKLLGDLNLKYFNKGGKNVLVLYNLLHMHMIRIVAPNDGARTAREIDEVDRAILKNIVVTVDTMTGNNVICHKFSESDQYMPLAEFIHYLDDCIYNGTIDKNKIVVLKNPGIEGSRLQIVFSDSNGEISYINSHDEMIDLLELIKDKQFSTYLPGYDKEVSSCTSASS